LSRAQPAVDRVEVIRVEDVNPAAVQLVAAVAQAVRPAAELGHRWFRDSSRIRFITLRSSALATAIAYL
jgi:hypothetical protein